MRALIRCLPLLALPACWVTDAEVDARFAELTDADGDGYQDRAYGGDDCDDHNAAVFPGATEICNGIDDDCDGDADSELTEPWFPDDDDDGYGDAGGMSLTCDPQDGWVENDDDCDDGDADVYPGADEYCDGMDNDCDDEVDEGAALDAPTWFADADADGYGDADTTAVACGAPSGYSDDDTDCDDSDDAVFPGADERCNGIDDDCDEAVDEDDAVDAPTWYEDGDEDGYGDPDSTTTACTQPVGYLDDDSDCDDADDDIHPGGLEMIGDADDSDCSGEADSFVFTLHDTRDSDTVRGPRLAQGAGQVLLAWAAEELDDGGSLFDAVAVSVFDGSDPLGGEQDFHSDGEPSGLAQLGRMDLVANDELWVVGSSWIDGDSRDIRLDAVGLSSMGSGSYVSTSDWTLPFDQLQLGLSYQGNVTAIGCGLGAAGVQVVQLSASSILSGAATSTRDTSVHDAEDDHDICEYDHVSYYLHAFDSVRQQYDIYVFDGTSDELITSPVDSGGWEVADLEFTSSEDHYVLALSNLASGNGIQLQAAELPSTMPPLPSFEFDWYTYYGYTASSVLDLDVAVNPDGVPWACVVDGSGNAMLLWTELIGVSTPVLEGLNLDPDPLGAVEECAITITDHGVAWIALRSGDDIATAVVRVP
jgi:hypothetical protein